jgi:hypothetical protein
LNSYTNREPADGEEEHPIVIKDDRSDSDSEAEGSEAEGSEADSKGPKLGTHFAFIAMDLSNNQQMMEMTVAIAMMTYLSWRISSDTHQVMETTRVMRSYLCWRNYSNSYLPTPIPNLRCQTGIKQMI